MADNASELDHDDEVLSFAPDVEADVEYEIVEDEVKPDVDPDDDPDADDDVDPDADPDADTALDTDPDVDPDADDDDDEVDAELKTYSKNVQKRIQREIRAKKAVQEELVEIKTKASGYIAKLHDEGKKTFDQAVSLQKQYDEMQDSYATLLEQSLNEKAEFLQERLRRAKEEGNTEVEVKAMSELQTLSVQRGELQNITRTIKGTREKREAPKNIWELSDEAKAAQAAAAAAPAKAKATPRGEKWMQARSWYGKPKFVEATEYAHIVDRKLVADGLNPNSKEYFTELDRRIAKRFPELYKAKAKTTTTPVAPVSSGTSRATAPKGKVILTKVDLQKMQRFGLDPSNKAHLREWAKQKSAS